MNAILAALATDANVAPGLRSVLAPAPKTYRASTGWHRTFLSPGDADQYDRGYSLHPHPMPPAQGLSTPFSTGWMDAESDAIAREDARRDAARERYEEASE